MEYAIWNGERISAFDVSQDYHLEKQIRLASGKKQLSCPDKNCGSPILRYCHGEKKEAYFAHLCNSSCDYSEFDRNNTDIIRSIRRKFYDHFKSIGLAIELEVKILEHHYSHLLVTTDSAKQIAVEFGTQSLSANKIDSLSAEYMKHNIAVKWIVIGDISQSVKENCVFFLKRYLLNESVNNDFIVVSSDGKEVAQYRIDPNEYKYKGKEIPSKNYPQDFRKNGTVEDVIFEDEELSIKGFHDEYSKWLITKKRAFHKRVATLEAEEQKENFRIQYAKQLPTSHKTRAFTDLELKNLLKPTSTINRYAPSESSIRKSYYEVKDKFTQQTTPIRDSNDRRWVQCERCGEIKLDSEFSSYGGENRTNLGICSECDRLNRKS